MTAFQKLPFRLLQAEALFIQLLLPPVDAVHHARKRAMLRPLCQFLTRHQQTVAQPALQSPIQILRLRFDLLSRPDHQFGRRRRCRRPQIGYKIHNREIRLVPNRRNHRNLRIGNRSCHALMIETGKIFSRASES